MLVRHTLSIDDATKKMIPVIKGMAADDLLEVYYELFPEERAVREDAYVDVAPLMERIMDHIGSGLEPEEVVDLWNVVFPWNREVYFDEEDNFLHLIEDESAPQGAVD